MATNELPSVTVTDDAPFIVVAVSARRFGVAKLLNVFNTVPTFQLVGLGKTSFSYHTEAHGYAIRLTAEHLIKKLGATPARDAAALRRGVEALKKLLEQHPTRVPTELIEEARTLIDSCERMASVVDELDEEEAKLAQGKGDVL